MTAKEAAAAKAVSLIEDGMSVGFGSGSTVDCGLRTLGRRVEQGLRVRLVVASNRSAATAREAGLMTTDLSAVERLDLVIDGTDETDPHLNLIKGGGAALVREKLLAAAGDRVVIAADASKRVPVLGAFPLPVAIVPWGAAHTLRRLERHCAEVSLRGDGAGPLVTDDGLWIADLHCRRIDDPAGLERAIRSELGVVEVGLFVGMADQLILGHPDGRTEVLER